MTPTPKTSRALTDPSGKGARIASRVGRIAAIGVMLVVVLWSIGSAKRFVGLLNAPPIEFPTTANRETPMFADSQPLVDPLGGWIIAGSNWHCSQLRYDNDQFDAEWKKLLDVQTSPLPPANEDEKQLNQSLFEILRLVDTGLQTPFAALGISNTKEQPRSEGEPKQYTLRLGTCEIHVFSVDDDGERLLEILAVLADPEGGRQIFRLRRSQESEEGIRHYDSLLPFPLSARPLCSRIDRHGVPILEMVGLDTTAEQLTDFWRKNGWRVPTAPPSLDRTIFLTSNDFRLPEPPKFSVTCFRDDRRVHAWSTDPPDQLKTIFLFRCL